MSSLSSWPLSSRVSRRISAFTAGASVAALLGSLLPAAAASVPAAGATSDSRRDAAAVHYHPGAPGAGDPYFPMLGNGGYNVLHYGLHLRYAPAKRHLAGAARISARSTQNLSRFNLDLSGFKVGEVSVNRTRAVFHRRGEELIIRPAYGIRAGHKFLVVVHYGGHPRTVKDSPLIFGGGDYGWRYTKDGAWVAGEPKAAHTWFPCNDHPSDKASFTFAITVPSTRKVVANGTLAAKQRTLGHTTYTWRERQPMATYLATIDIGKWRFHRTRTARGTPSIAAIDPRLEKQARDDHVIGFTNRITDEWERTFGPYPFGSTGAIVDQVNNVGFSLETQTRPIYGFAPDPVTIAHELAHMWFGDSVSVRRWRNIWLNEGFATYAQFLFIEHDGGPSTWQFTKWIYQDLKPGDPFWKLSIADPGPRHMFDPQVQVYLRGMMTLGALRHTIGGADMRQLLRTWVRVHRYGNVTTHQFTSLAERISGMELTRFFRLWLWRQSKPPLPATKTAKAPPPVVRTLLHQQFGI
jgi:aminopeptidase N